MTSPTARSNAYNGSFDLKMVIHVKLLIVADIASVRMMFQNDSTSDDVLLYRLLNPAHTTDKAVISSSQWSTNEHIYYVRDIRHHKVESVISNVSGIANQPLTTRPITKINNHQLTVHELKSQGDNHK